MQHRKQHKIEIRDAAREGDFERVQQLLTCSCARKARAYALAGAAETGNRRLVITLYRNGIDLDLAIIAAARSGHAGILIFLLRKEGKTMRARSPSLQPKGSYTARMAALTAAASAGQTHIVSELLRLDPKLDRTEAFRTAISGEHFETAKLLCDGKVPIELITPPVA